MFRSIQNSVTNRRKVESEGGGSKIDLSTGRFHRKKIFKKGKFLFSKRSTYFLLIQAKSNNLGFNSPKLQAYENGNFCKNRIFRVF